MKNVTILEFILPARVIIGVKKKKKISLTMNWYRNAYHYQNASVKKIWQPLYKPDPPEIPFRKYIIEYKIYFPDDRRTDMLNWISVIDKFFTDWMVSNGYANDDSWRDYDKVRISASRDRSLKDIKVEAVVHGI